MVLPRKLKNLAEEYRKGIAAAIGLPPEAISPEIVDKWVREWSRAFITPEAFRQIFGHSSPTRVERATEEMMRDILRITQMRPIEIRERRRKIIGGGI